MSLLVWVHASDCLMHLKKIISQNTGYPAQIQHLLYGGKSLQDDRTLTDYNILSTSSLILNLKLRGGAATSSKINSAGGGIGSSTSKSTESKQKQKNESLSFKNIIQGKNTVTTPSNPTGFVSNPYIVEQLNYTPELNIDTLEIDEHCATIESQVIICRFNYFLPKLIELFHWIFTNWTIHCEIHLCSKGFFIVNFPTSDARDIILQE